MSLMTRDEAWKRAAAAYSTRGIWKTKAQEFKQPLANLLLHACEGALAVMVTDRLGGNPNHAAVAVTAFGPAWEIGGYYASGKKRSWKASVLGMLAFGVGSALGLVVAK